MDGIIIFVRNDINFIDVLKMKFGSMCRLQQPHEAVINFPEDPFIVYEIHETSVYLDLDEREKIVGIVNGRQFRFYNVDFKRRAFLTEFVKGLSGVDGIAVEIDDKIIKLNEDDLGKNSESM